MKKRFIVFGDVHCCKNWDIIDKNLVPEGQRPFNFLNPNRELRQFVNQMNDSGDVCAVINTGDCVDYHFCDYRTVSGFLKKPPDRRQTNWDLFNRIIKRLKPPYYCIPGNHDYRKEAYNYRFWGTDHVNLDRSVRSKIKHKIGHHKFRGPFELAAVATDKKKFNPVRSTIGIRSRDKARINGFLCLFLDNGCDAFARKSTFLKYFKKVIKTRMLSYDPQGLMQTDLDFVSRTLSKEKKSDILIFQHAPLINPRHAFPGTVYQLTIRSFSHTIQRQKLCYNTILNGGGRLLDILRNSNANITLICSHTHTARYFLINKQSLAAEQVSLEKFNRNRDNNEYIKHLTTLPLGGFYPGEGGNRTGYLEISKSGFNEVVLKTCR